MSVVSAVRPLLRDATRVDRSKITLVVPLRNAIGTVAPLAVGAATGQTIVGLTICIGALQVAFSDRPGPYGRRGGRMLLASLASAAAVFVGGTTGAIDWLAVALAALWGFGGGMLVALSPAATQIGLSSVILLLVYAARPLTLTQAGGQAGLIVAGGLLQTALAIAAWPARRYGPQRADLAAVFRQLAASVAGGAAPQPGSAPPATDAITAARATLTGAGSDHSAAGEAFRTLLDEAERIRLELLALTDTCHRRKRGHDGDEAALHRIEAVVSAAGAVLAALADGLEADQPPAGTAPPLQRIDAQGHALREQSARETDATRRARSVAVLARVNALAGQLRAAVDVATLGAASDEVPSGQEARRPAALRLREPLSILRANLTLRSAACRHAVRLACCLAAADALGRALHLPRAYWVPLTAAIVLKPDFTATMARGIGRVAGTIVGLVLATALVYAVFGQIAGRVFLVGLGMFIIRSVGPANYGLLVVAVTALVVVLTSFAGARPEATIVDRGIGTLLGGALAIVAYGAWPTWERTQTPFILADLLDAYRRYFVAVMAGYLDPRGRDVAALDRRRNAARLARSNAAASVDRLRAEPARDADELDRADGLLANSHRLAHSAMALEAGLYEDAEPLAPSDLAALTVFAGDVETTLHMLARVLRHPSSPLGDLPDLRADQRALAEPDLAAPDTPTLPSAYRRSIVAGEADRIANSINTMTEILRRQSKAIKMAPTTAATMPDTRTGSDIGD